MATTQDFNYPSSSDVTVTGIGNPIGQPFPSSAVPIAGENPSGLLTPIQTNAAGDLITIQAAGAIDNVNLTEVGGAAISEGQKTSANSLPVVIASDQSPLPINAASLPLPTGAATSANQATEITSLASIVTNTAAIEANQTNGTQVTSVSNFPSTQPVSGTVTANQGTSPWVENLSQFGGAAVSLGSKVSASSIPVVIASDDIVAISATALPLPTGASTSANQTTANTSLASILANQTNGTQTTALLAGTAVIGTVIIEPRDGSLTDNSGTTSATPSTSTQIMAANSSRRYLLIENVSTTATIWINFTSAATAGNGSFALLPGGSIVQETGFVSTEAVNVLSTTASVPFTAKQA